MEMIYDENDETFDDERDETIDDESARVIDRITRDLIDEAVDEKTYRKTYRKIYNTIKRIARAMDWLPQPVRLSIDREATIHVVLSVRIGDIPHHCKPHAGKQSEDTVAMIDFIDILMPYATKSISITFKRPNVIDKVEVRSRNDCLIIYNVKGAPPLTICTLMEALQVDKGTTSRALKRIARGNEDKVHLTHPRDEWMLSQNRA